jgi:hypothetical protein
LWRTADGKEIAICNMADNHLRNAALFLMGMGYRTCIADSKVRVVWLKIFATEWQRRMLAREEERNKRWQTDVDDPSKKLEDIINHGSKQLR